MNKALLASAVAAVMVLGTGSLASAQTVGVILHSQTNVPYALCAASATTPTKKFITINGHNYRLGIATCPVITTGTSSINLALTGGRSRPRGTNTIWSAFGSPASFPQQQTNGNWIIKSAKRRSFKMSATPGGGSSNMWSFPCVIQTRQLTATNGVKFTVATCQGPLMENLNNQPIAYGSQAITEAAPGMPNPIVIQLSTLFPTF